MSDSSLIDKVCLIGESIRGNPTHFMVEQALAAARLDWRFLSFEAAPDRLGDALRGIESLGFRGALLLPSYQEPAVQVLPHVTERARVARRVTCLYEAEGRLVGDDLGGPALVTTLGGAEAVAGRDAVVFGAQGRALSSAMALLASGVGSLTIAHQGDDDPDLILWLTREAFPDREVDAAAVDDGWAGVPPPGPAGVVVASACGPKARDPAVAGWLAPWIGRGTMVADLRVRGDAAPLAREGASRGARSVNGLDVLATETAEAIRLWTGVRVDRAVLHDAAEEFLGV